MLSVKNNQTWEDVTISINNKALGLKGDDEKKITFLFLKMMESVYYRLFDLVTQSKYDKVKKAKMKTELKRITIGTVEKCLLDVEDPSNKNTYLQKISKFFTDKGHHFHNKIVSYANYAIEEETMRPYFIDGALEIADLEYKKLMRRLECDDFDFTRKPTHQEL